MPTLQSVLDISPSSLEPWGTKVLGSVSTLNLHFSACASTGILSACHLTTDLGCALISFLLHCIQPPRRIVLKPIFSKKWNARLLRLLKKSVQNKQDSIANLLESFTICYFHQPTYDPESWNAMCSRYWTGQIFILFCFEDPRLLALRLVKCLWYSISKNELAHKIWIKNVIE
jgi:hypothetical protein